MLVVAAPTPCNHQDVAATGVQDLALLMEVAELYCLTCPTGRFRPLHRDTWNALQQAAQVSSYPVQAQFAATHGETLLSIAEYLVEDVLVTSSAAEGGASGNGGSASSGSSSGSSSSKRHPRTGNRNRQVTLDHHVWWTQNVITTLSILMKLQEFSNHTNSGGYLEKEGEALGWERQPHVAHAALQQPQQQSQQPASDVAVQHAALSRHVSWHSREEGCCSWWV
jgi:hypothetical protein